MSLNSIPESIEVQKHSVLLRECYQKLCGKPFPIDLSKLPLAEALYTSDWIIVSHGVEKDPIFNYANCSAQALWGIDWENFTQLPSRLSAREDKVEKREAALKEAFAKGYIENYVGIRIDAEGKEFYIRNVTLWNLIDREGSPLGQAAMFDTWEYL
ncbi:MAG: MEKHLA domain-containing protein [Cytophagaceae bacterium]|nr:MEKHLA domain-containing protein [Cytophagaceae bacterium]